MSSKNKGRLLKRPTSFKHDISFDGWQKAWQFANEKERWFQDKGIESRLLTKEERLDYNIQGILAETAFAEMFNLEVTMELMEKGERGPLYDFDFPGGMRVEVKAHQDWHQYLTVAKKHSKEDFDFLVAMTGFKDRKGWRMRGWERSEIVMQDNYFRVGDPKFRDDLWAMPLKHLQPPETFFSQFIKKGANNGK